MSCDKISAFNYSGPIWGFQGHWREAATTSLQPLEEPSSAQIASRLPLKTNWSAQTHTEGGCWKRFTGRGNCTFYGWREGVSIWYLVMVDIYGKSYWRVGPLYYIDHRPSLVSWTSPDVRVRICNFDFGFLQIRKWTYFDITWCPSPQTLQYFLAVTITVWRNRSNRWTRLFAYWYKLGWWMPMLAVYFIDPWNV